MKRDYTRAVWIGVGGLLLAGALYIALAWFEIVDQPEWVGAQGEARTDPYYAMRQLLGKMGAPTRAIKQFAELDELPAGATLFLGDRRLARMSPVRVARLVDWVKAGGQLVVEAEQPKLDDPLLKAFGLSHAGLRWTPKGWRERSSESEEKTVEDERGVDAESLPEADAQPNRAVPIKPPLTRGSEISMVQFADGAAFKVMFVPYQNLRVITPRIDAFALRDKAGLRLVQFAEGRGRVTAISNFDFMTWRSLGRQDHAEFLWHITRPPAEPEAAAVGAQRASPLVVLALRTSEGGLLAWLAQHAWMALWALLALLIAWIVRMVVRFGPLLPPASGARRSLGEHLAAMGRYIGARHRWGALLQAARERFLLRLQHERPGLHRASAATILNALQQMSGIGAARIQQALYAEIPDRHAFAQAIRTLKALERVLATSSRIPSLPVNHLPGN